MSAAAITSRTSYSPAPISLQEKAGQALHIFGYTLARPFQWISTPLLRAIYTPLRPHEYENCHIKAIEVVRRVVTIPTCAAIAIPSALLALCGAGIDSLADCLKSKPYNYYKGDAEEVAVIDRPPSFLVWNTCMTYGGVPWAFGLRPAFTRVNKVAKLINENNPGVAVLQEMAFGPSLALYERLKKRYAHFYFRIGPNPKGIESCLFVASQYALVSEPQFTPFHGYTWMKRGYFCLETAQFWVITTHMEPKDKQLRAIQFKQITRRMQELSQTKPCFLLGDLNFDRTGNQDDEYTQLEVVKNFHDPHPHVDVGTCTDALVTHMQGKKRPERLWELLDYALFMPSTRVQHNFSLNLQVIRNACNPEKPEEALSDHRALCLTCEARGSEKKEGGSA